MADNRRQYYRDIIVTALTGIADINDTFRTDKFPNLTIEIGQDNIEYVESEGYELYEKRITTDFTVLLLFKVNRANDNLIRATGDEYIETIENAIDTIDVSTVNFGTDRLVLESVQITNIDIGTQQDNLTSGILITGNIISYIIKG